MTLTDHLNAGDLLHNGEYLVSANGVFFAIMENDGNFSVYRGSGPSDEHGLLWSAHQTPAPAQYFAALQDDGNFCVYKGTGWNDNQGLVWGAHEAPGPGAYFAVIQNDGNFCVYKGTGWSDMEGVVWATKTTDPVVDFGFSSISYDVANATIVPSAPSELFRQPVTNNSDKTQISTIGGEESVTETSAWSNALGASITVKSTFEVGIPFVADGKVETSATVSDTFTWSGSTTRSKKWNFTTPVKVPPHSEIVAIVVVSMSDITVPYEMTGTCTLQSGARVPGKVIGQYTGTSSHDIAVTYAQENENGELVSGPSQPIAATVE